MCIMWTRLVWSGFRTDGTRWEIGEVCFLWKRGKDSFLWILNGVDRLVTIHVKRFWLSPDIVLGAGSS